MLRPLIGTLIFLATLLVVMTRPYRIPEAVAAVAGALLMLLGGYLSPGDAWDTLRGQWNVYGFFLGLMVISAVADQAGIFDALAARAARWAAGSALRLYLAVFLVGVGITAFLSNDATALTLTPIVYALVTRLRLPALPFMFACTFIADTASFLLPVSNPINVLALDAFGGGLGPFLRHLLLPSLVCIGCNVGVFCWLFRRELRLRYEPPAAEAGTSAPRPFFRVTAIGLGLIAAGYLVASAVALPLSPVALGGGALLVAGAARCGRLDWRALGRDISWPLFAFLSGLFILVRGVERLGVTAVVGTALHRVAGAGAFPAVLATAGGTALGANLINNVPMALVMISALRTTAGPLALHQRLVYATILGADLGPNLTTVGSLATILWLLILRRRGLEVSTAQYLKLGLTVVPAMLLVGAALIWLGL
jgi:arsenical pump membrane protein